MTDGSFSGQDIEFDLLPPDESLDSDLLGEDSDDDGPGYSPPERRSSELSWGFTAREARAREPLAARLAREVPEHEPEEPMGDGIGDIIGTDGEILDDQVGSVRAGRLIWTEPGNPDPSSDFWASDIGIDNPEMARILYASAIGMTSLGNASPADHISAIGSLVDLVLALR